jgi:hypothetical protein
MFVVVEHTEFGIKVRHKQERHDYVYPSARHAGGGKRVLGTPTLTDANADHSAQWFEPDARKFAEAEARKLGIID